MRSPSSHRRCYEFRHPSISVSLENPLRPADRIVVGLEGRDLPLQPLEDRREHRPVQHHEVSRDGKPLLKPFECYRLMAGPHRPPPAAIASVAMSTAQSVIAMPMPVTCLSFMMIQPQIHTAATAIPAPTVVASPSCSTSAPW